MTGLIHLGGGVFRWVLQTTWQAAVLAGLILLAQLLLRKRLSPSWRYGLWLLLIVRLLMPAQPQSAFSIFNLARTSPVLPVAISPPSVAPLAAVTEPQVTFQPNVSAITETREAPVFVPTSLATKPAVKINWFGVAFCGWLAGVCFFGARLIWTNARFRSRIRRYQPVADENATGLLNECLATFNIAHPVRLIESEEIESPAVYGFWQKWLLLPDGVFERFSTQELRCIFLHELAHIKRGDLGVNWLVACLQVLHWFNPVLWLAWSRMRSDRELATDALALAHVRESDHAPYGETILKVLEGLTGERALPGLVGIVESKAQLKERLTAIARPGKSWKWAAFVAVALLAGLGLTGAQTEKSGTFSKQVLTNRVEPTNGKNKSNIGPVMIDPKSPLTGTVRLPDGMPAKNAKVRFKDPDHNEKGETLNGLPNEVFVLTDANGAFSVERRETAEILDVAHDAGFAKLPRSRWINGVKIVLLPWGRVEGVLRISNHVAANAEIGLMEEGFTLGDARHTIRTDAEGRFTFNQVSAGDYSLWRFVASSNQFTRSETSTEPIDFEVHSGETTNLAWGGKGRPVVGKCVVENVKDLPAIPTITLRLNSPYQLPPPTAGDKGKMPTQRQLAEWEKSDAGKEARQNRHNYGAYVAVDGSFQVDDVMPGTYQLSFAILPHQSAFMHSPPRQIVVPPLSDPKKCEPFDLGDVRTSFAGSQVAAGTPQIVKQGDSARTLSTKTLDGQPLRLSDYRGKYVLLDLRLMLSAADAKEIEAVNDSFAQDDRFVIISLCQDADDGFARYLQAKRVRNWIQGYLDYYATGRDYGWPGAQNPVFHLIDPQGKIVASGLRGDAIQSTVAMALAGR